MTTELAKIDYKEFGLKEKEASKIKSGLSTILKEREVLIDAYEDTINLEITEETIPTFKSLRLLISKNRTQGLKVWHKTNKAYFLAGGNFVQAIYNREVSENERMESALMDAEKHFENIEKERIAKLSSERTIELSNYEPDMIIPNLGEMDESVWRNFLGGIISGYNKRKEEEAKTEAARIENERLCKLELTRRNKAYELKQFWHEPDFNFRKMTDTEFDNLMTSLGAFKFDYEQKQIKIEEENTRLKKESEKRERLAKIEQGKRDNAEKERLAKQKVKDDAAAKLLADEKARAKKLQDEIEEKAASAEKERLAKVKANKVAAQAPDKDKLIKSINEMVFIDSEFKTAEAEAVYNVINQKFEAFKTWAIAQTKSL